MMRRFLHILFAAAALTFAVPADIQAQEVANQGLEFSTRTHNFGKISVSEGPKHCTFEFKNTSGKPIVINNVISSCGCTEPKWPKKPIMPGEEGKIEVTYLNDQGPYPFATSELPSHLTVHNWLLAKGSPYRASLHTHPIELVALTHSRKWLEKDAEIAIFTPLHGCIDCNRWGIKELENSEMWLGFGGIQHKCRLFMTKLPDTNINVFFVHIFSFHAFLFYIKRKKKATKFNCFFVFLLKIFFKLNYYI